MQKLFKEINTCFLIKDTLNLSSDMYIMLQIMCLSNKNSSWHYFQIQPSYLD